MAKNALLCRVMYKVGHIIHTVVRFYYEGFRSMTTGRVLWYLILVKLFIIFVVLRLLFFRPTLSGLTTQQKQEHVAGALTERGIP